MPSRRVWDSLQAVARMVGWLTSIAALVVMAYVINKWPRSGGAVAAAMVGTGVAILNDSWEMVSILDRSGGFIRLSHTRVLMHDLFSLALTVGGIVLVLFSESGPAYTNQGVRRRELHGIYDKKHMLRASLYLQGGVVAWRFIFSVAGCLNTSQSSRRSRTAAQERRERRIVAALA
ncbi:hypothetical protein NLU13_2496 [Sarocladium strictum]|uniref:Uncharacterized protein n=1 Tax=Sarocladium strictum TaxID=5046 RepID=A0AA39GL39_SARSR|nr:hypothetical protein NLU13_2496 [Sarocladium strictum]